MLKNDQIEYFLKGFTGFCNPKLVLIAQTIRIYSGAEFFPKEDYQKSFGGAYILVPLANEKRNEEGEVVYSWSETYAHPLYNLINEFNEEELEMSQRKLWLIVIFVL